MSSQDLGALLGDVGARGRDHLRHAIVAILAVGLMWSIFDNNKKKNITSGINLYIVNKYVELHYGKLDIQSDIVKSLSRAFDMSLICVRIHRLFILSCTFNKNKYGSK